MEAKCAPAFLHQLSARRDSRRKPRGIGSGQLAADDLPALPGALHTGTGADMVFNCPRPGIEHRADFSAQIECVKRKRSTLRFSKGIVVSNAAELKWRKKLLRVVGTRLRDARRNQDTSEIERLQKMQTELRQAPAVPGADHPKVRAAIHRAIKTRRAWIKRQLQSGSVLLWKDRKALETKLQRLDDLETTLFGVQRRRVARSFLEYGGKTPTADDVIHNAVIWRCLETGKAHLILPKLAEMFPENYSDALADEMTVDPRVKQATRRIKAKQIVGSYEDPIERLIAENYFESKVLSKPLCRLSRDHAVEQLEKYFQKVITVDKYRRHVKSLFLREYS